LFFCNHLKKAVMKSTKSIQVVNGTYWRIFFDQVWQKEPFPKGTTEGQAKAKCAEAGGSFEWHEAGKEPVLAN